MFSALVLLRAPNTWCHNHTYNRIIECKSEEHDMIVDRVDFQRQGRNDRNSQKPVTWHGINAELYNNGLRFGFLLLGSQFGIHPVH